MPLIFFFIVFFVAIVVVVVVVVAAALFVVVVDRHRRLTNRRPCSLSILLADLYNEFPDYVQTAEQKKLIFFVQQSVIVGIFII
jgi:hypothetical protein